MGSFVAAGLIGILLSSDLVPVEPLACCWFDRDAVYTFMVWSDESNTVVPTGHGSLVVLRAEHGHAKPVSHCLPSKVKFAGRGCALPMVRSQMALSKIYIAEMGAAVNNERGDLADAADRIHLSINLCSFPTEVLRLPQVVVGEPIVWEKFPTLMQSFYNSWENVCSFIDNDILTESPNRGVKANDPVRPFDYIVSDGGLVEKYVLREGALYRRMMTSRKPHRIEWGSEQRWAAPRLGRFRAVANGKRRFFVTEQGRVFAIPTDEVASSSLVTVWEGEPVRFLVYDTVRGVSYAFTNEKFFVVGDTVRPHGHSLGPLKANTALEVIGMHRKCTRVVQGSDVASVPSPR